MQPRPPDPWPRWQRGPSMLVSTGTGRCRPSRFRHCCWPRPSSRGARTARTKRSGRNLEMRLAALLGMLAAMAFCLPATVLAQSAGDDQYVDPFQDVPEQPTGGGSQGGNSQSPPDTESGAPSGTTEGSVGTAQPSDSGEVVE